MSRGTFHERKAERTAYFKAYIFGWKLRKCTSCAGSGHYDNHGSPKCSACDGTDKTWHKPAIPPTTDPA